MPAILLGCLIASLALHAWQRPRILKMAEFREKTSLYKQPLYSRSFLFNFNIKIEYCEN